MTVTVPARELRELAVTARRLTSRGRGILAADESIATMSARLEADGITATAAARRDYRQLLLTTPDLRRYVSGIIFSDETFGQELSDGRDFPTAALDLHILPGIKVDTGTVALPGHEPALVTEGLDGLGERLGAYAARGAAFAKWRAVFDVESITPYSARVNAQALARYAALCQMHGIVPIVEPEVLAAGDQDLLACASATRLALNTLFEELDAARVDLTGIVLKPNFVTPGLAIPAMSANTVATITFDVLRDTVPASVPGIAFLSGGHTTEDACNYLAAINTFRDARWSMTFSFGRALVSDALAIWGGSPANFTLAQQALANNVERAASAVRGHS